MYNLPIREPGRSTPPLHTIAWHNTGYHSSDVRDNPRLIGKDDHPQTRIQCPPNQTCAVFRVIHRSLIKAVKMA